MVEYTSVLESKVELGKIFSSLADDTRRDILKRLGKNSLTISQLAEPYQLGFAAVSKHLKVLEKAGLIIKRRVGRQHYVQLAPAGFKDAAEYLEFYRSFWESQLNSLEDYLRKENQHG